MAMYAEHLALSTERLKCRVVIGSLFNFSYFIFNLLARNERDKPLWTGYEPWDSVHSWLL